jgi:serine/threonine protein kinase
MGDGSSSSSDSFGPTPRWAGGGQNTLMGRSPPARPVSRAPADVTKVAYPPRFHVLRRLGVGGMAEVFAALRQEPDGRQRPVVIKRPLPDLAAHPEFLAMFLDEARIASSLEHPNIVRVFEIVHQPDCCLIVMELVDGKSVSSLLARLEKSGQRLESRLAAHVVARAAEGLHYAHTRTDAVGTPLKIVHRDVSPQNVLVSFGGEVKVIDFGIAHALGRVTQTRTGTRKGKTGYMAPEQARAGAIDSRVDVFALGILLWELSCGRRLFVRPDDFRTMNALLVDPIPLPSSVAAVPPQLEEITMRALARDPNDRYQSAEELRADLDAFALSAGGASPAELGALVKVLFATDAPMLLQEQPTPQTTGQVVPAVVTRQTAPLRRRGYDRRQLAMLVAGAAIAATMGGGLGWLGNHFHGGVVARAASAKSAPTSGPNSGASIEPLAKKAAAAGPRPYPSWPAAANAAEALPATTVPVPTAATPANVAGAASLTPAEAPTTSVAADEAEDAARAKKAAAAARRARRLLAKSNPF